MCLFPLYCGWCVGTKTTCLNWQFGTTPSTLPGLSLPFKWKLIKRHCSEMSSDLLLVSPWRSAAQSYSLPTPSSRGTRPPPAGTGGRGSPPSHSLPSCSNGERSGFKKHPCLIIQQLLWLCLILLYIILQPVSWMITMVITNIAKQDSHSSKDFKGAHIVHKDRLLPVYPGHEVFHVGGYDPWFPSEVRLVIDNHLEAKSDWLSSTLIINTSCQCSMATLSMPRSANY